MFIRVINPSGYLTTYDLSQIHIWRLEIAALNTELGVGLRYFIGTQTQVGMIAATDTQTKEFIVGIAGKGFPHKDREQSRESFEESVRAIHNSALKSKQADQAIQGATGLFDEYYKIYDALRTGSEEIGSYEGYRYCINNDANPFPEF